MSRVFDWNLWWPFFVTLAVGTTITFVAALLVQRWTGPMAWQRTIWQIAFLSLGLLVMTEISGGSRACWNWLRQTAASKLDGQVLVESRVIGEPDVRMLLAEPSRRINPGPARPTQGQSVAQSPAGWPGAIWLLSLGVALTWMLLTRLVFLIFVPCRKVEDRGLLARVDSLARQLGILGRVRVTETRGLAGPIAFGIFRPGISVPDGFAGRFTEAQQNTMLAHELAHLAAQDPAWHALADGVAAVLWWHPLVWLARRRLRDASEATADEASLLVENGPCVLAECLVELGGRLTRTHSLGWLGMAGGDFRSGLGRRVKRLLTMDNQAWNPPHRSGVWLVRVTASLAFVAVVLVGSVWAQPESAGPITFRHAFQRSVMGLALAAALPQAPPAMSPSQMVIEVKFCEMTTNDTRSLGFDWFLGTFDSTSFRQTNHHAVGFLTDPQYRVVLRALEQRHGVNLLSLPKVTTLSGRQVQVKAVNLRHVVTDLDWSQLARNAVAGAGESVEARPIAEQFELGPVLDVVPFRQADGNTIHLTLIATVTEFIGYDMSHGARSEIITRSDGRKEPITIPPQPRPIFRKRKMTSSVIAKDGETVVLAGVSDQMVANPRNDEPLREGTVLPDDAKKTQVLVFVTATQIDGAGNRLHPPEDLPPGAAPQKHPNPAP